jgi:NTP pyrophosphatase (non-canonical NTP hydrolase)
MNIQEIAKNAHEINKINGFWDTERNFNQLIMLVITEISEAVESHRKGKYADANYFLERISVVEESLNDALPVIQQAEHLRSVEIKAFENEIKDTFEDEIADTMIRVLDLMQGFDIEIRTSVGELMSFKSYVGNCETIAGCLLAFTTILCDAGRQWDSGDESRVSDTLNIFVHLLVWWCEQKDLDLEFHILKKVWYNSTREKLHGKIY